MDTDKFRDEGFHKAFLDGDDVPTTIGVGAFMGDNNKLVPYASATVDYADVKESLRESYAKTFEEGWKEKYLERGFDITRKAPNIVTVASKRQALSIEFAGGDIDALKAPSFFVDLYGDEDPINMFYQFAEKTKIWVFHIRTTTHSYIWTVSYPDGKILNAIRRDPITIVNKDGGNL